MLPFFGTAHTMDLAHEWDMDPSMMAMFYYAKLDMDKFPTVRDNFRGYIATFVKTGSPVGAFDNPQWPQYEVSDQKYMYINSYPEVREKLVPSRLSFWTSYAPANVK